MFWSVLGLSAVVSLSSMAVLHDFHYSRTDSRWQGESRTLQTTIRVFTDDVERALRHHHSLSEDVNLWLGDPHEWAEADSALVQWLAAHLSMEINGVPVKWTWVGKEIELDVSYLYLESQPFPECVDSWSVQNTLFFPEFDDQVNEVQLRIDRGDNVPLERREMLTSDLPSLVWRSQVPESPPSDD